MAALFDCERPTRFGEFRQVGVRVFPQLEEPEILGARGLASSVLWLREASKAIARATR